MEGSISKKLKGKRQIVKGKRQKVGYPLFCLLSFYFLLFTFFSCTPDPPPTLNFQDREILDSLYKLQIDSLKIVLDSLCEVRHDSAVQFKVDSMMQERLAEIERYLERIRSSQ